VIPGEQEIARRQRKLGDLLAHKARDVLAVVKAYPTAEAEQGFGVCRKAGSRPSFAYPGAMILPSVDQWETGVAAGLPK
jgi:hypothetical protein